MHFVQPCWQLLIGEPLPTRQQIRGELSCFSEEEKRLESCYTALKEIVHQNNKPWHENRTEDLLWSHAEETLLWSFILPSIMHNKSFFFFF